jgi:hypothetical protein
LYWRVHFNTTVPENRKQCKSRSDIDRAYPIPSETPTVRVGRKRHVLATISHRLGLSHVVSLCLASCCSRRLHFLAEGLREVGCCKAAGLSTGIGVMEHKGVPLFERFFLSI